MNRIVLSAFITLIGLFTFGQTPQIMHKMFGGAQANFNETLQNPNASIRQTNFGLPPTIYVKKALVDSIIALNDSTVIIVTSHRVVEDFDFNEYEYSLEDSAYVCSDSMIKKSLTYDKTGDWKPGRDTLMNHAVFNAKLTCNEILSTLNYEYRLRTYGGQEIVFIGFDCSKEQSKKKKNSMPIFWLSSPFDPNLWMMVVALISGIYFMILRKRKAVFSF